ncbi:hypothetical protein Tco_1483710 [Tanacetum coccineum]
MIISWKSSDDDQEDEKAQDDEDEDKYDVNETTQDDEDDDVHGADENAQDDDDEEQSESEDDGDDFIHPKLTTHDDEIIHEEGKKMKMIVLIATIFTHPLISHHQMTKTVIMKLKGRMLKEQVDERAIYTRGQGNEAVRRYQFHLEGRDDTKAVEDNFSELRQTNQYAEGTLLHSCSKTHKQSASQSAPVEETMQTTDVFEAPAHQEFETGVHDEQAEEEVQHLPDCYTRELNLTKPDNVQIQSERQKDAYTPYSDPRGFIYENKDKKNRLMRIDKTNTSFHDVLVDDVQTALNDRLKGIRMEYLPQTF